MNPVTFAQAHPSVARYRPEVRAVQAEQLQAAFDTEGAHLAVRRLRTARRAPLIPADLAAFIRAQPRREWIGVPLVIALFGAALFGFALVTP